MNTSSGERRRSDRIWLTIPLRVEVKDVNGQTIAYPGRAISLSRHGGRIQISHALPRGQSIRLRSSIGHHEADFRVVETIADRSENDGEFGVECLNKEYSFWGIEFPPYLGDAVDAKVLLQCGMCLTIALKPLSISETQTLVANDNLSKYCAKCSGATLWWYAEIRVPWNRQPEKARGSIEGQRRFIPAFRDFVERGHRRMHMQISLWLHGRYGATSNVRTENFSKFGFSFSSEEEHLRGEIVTATFPFPSMMQQTQMPARIVREQILEGSANKIYGAKFDLRKGGSHDT